MEESKEIVAIRSEKLSRPYDDRYIILDKHTGEILDDAQGYGYKSPSKAYAAWAYTHRSKEQKKNDAAKKKQITKWLDENPDIVRGLFDLELDMVKGQTYPFTEVNTAFIRQVFKDNNLEVDFTPQEFLKVWKNYNPKIEIW